jgi:hypothetical protein
MYSAVASGMGRAASNARSSERVAVHQLHDHEVRATDVARVVDRHDVGVAKGHAEPRLVLEHGAKQRVRDVRQHALDGHGILVAALERGGAAPDLGHATHRDARDRLVLRGGTPQSHGNTRFSLRLQHDVSLR